MRAITLWQPWATLMAEGHKKIETRIWSTNVRGPVAIHSAKKPFEIIKKLIDPKTLSVMASILYPFSLKNLPMGYVLAVGNLVDCIKIDEAFVEALSPEELPMGDYTIGRYAWIFKDVKPLKKPIEAKGAQGFWNWAAPDGIEAIS